MTHRAPRTFPAVKFGGSTSPNPMLRGPMVTFSPDEDDVSLDDPWAESPEDREPEPEAAHDSGEPDDLEPPVEAEEEETSEAEGEAEEEAEAEEETPETAAADADAEGDEGEDEEPKPRRRDWRDRQLEKRAKQLDEAKREADEAKAEAARLRELFAKPEGERTQAEAEELRRSLRKEVEQEVRGEQYFQRINEGANRLFEDGAKQFGKTWGSRVNAAAELFGEEIAKRPDFLETVIDLENGPAVYHELAGDPDKLDAILAMPPHKSALALAKLSEELKAKSAPKPKALSRAPAPIKPLDKPAKAERSLEDLLNDPKADMKEIDRRIQEQERAARA